MKIRKLFSQVLIMMFLLAMPSIMQAQNQKVKLTGKDITLRMAFEQIEKQTGLSVDYDANTINVSKILTTIPKGNTLQEVMTQLLRGTGYIYTINQSHVIITVSSKTTVQVRNNTNEGTISGIVSDTNGDPLVGASVVVKGTSKGTATDLNGKYKVEASKGAVLLISYIGYVNQQVTVKDNSAINIQLSEDSRMLNEVVAIGYGNMKKSDLTGAISSVKADDLPRGGSTTLAQMLKGQTAGVSFSQTSSQPGAAVWLQIRGAATGASPLIVIDGIPQSTLWEPSTGLNFGKGDKESVLDNINPDDIQDIQILKDASATSIYGSRAAGGVMLITTKRGSENAKTNVSLKYSYTAQWMAEKPEVLSAKEYMKASNDSKLERWVKSQGYYPWGTKVLPEYDQLVQLFKSAGNEWNYDPNNIESFTGGTDWYDAVTHQGEIQQYDFSLNGGNKNTSYLVSLDYMGNEAIVKDNDYTRITGRMNLDHTFNKWIKGGISANYSRINSNDVPISAASGSTPLFAACRKYDPTIPIRDEYGNYSVGTLYSLAQNPASILDVSIETKKDNILASAYVEFKPIEWLSIKPTFGYDRKFANTGSYFPSTTQEGMGADGIANIVQNSISNYYMNIAASYNKTFAKNHVFGFMLGWEYQKTESDGFRAQNSGFAYDNVKWYNLGQGTYERPSVSSFYNVDRNASLISRLNYSYKNRYLLTANFRRDGSSNFAENKQWGNFGGVALAWRINEEKFLKKVDWLSNLKLRTGVGVTGYAGSLTGTQTYYTAGHDYYFNNKYTSGVGLAAIGNPNLSWESQQDINIGLDFGFFNNKLGGTIDVYERKINDRIGTKALMSYQEITSMNYNTQRIDKTQGLDLSLFGTLISRNSFTWNSQITFTYYRDYTTKRDPSEILDINNNYSYTWNDMWYYKSDGLIQPGETVSWMPGVSAGAVKIKDVDGYLYDANGKKVLDEHGKPQYSGAPDGKIDKADLVKTGNNTPRPFSWSNTFKYKNFDLNIYIYGNLNHYKTNDKLANISYDTYQGVNTSPYYFQRFTYNNTNSKIPAFTQTESTLGYGDYYIEKAWFIRLDNISLGYTLPKKLTKRVAESIRFYGTVKNIAVITPYKGTDPEYDTYSYPSVSSFTFGIDFKF